MHTLLSLAYLFYRSPRHLIAKEVALPYKIFFILTLDVNFSHIFAKNELRDLNQQRLLVENTNFLESNSKLSGDTTDSAAPKPPQIPLPWNTKEISLKKEFLYDNLVSNNCSYSVITKNILENMTQQDKLNCQPLSNLNYLTKITIGDKDQTIFMGFSTLLKDNIILSDNMTDWENNEGWEDNEGWNDWKQNSYYYSSYDCEEDTLCQFEFTAPVNTDNSKISGNLAKIAIGYESEQSNKVAINVIIANSINYQILGTGILSLNPNDNSFFDQLAENHLIDGKKLSFDFSNQNDQKLILGGFIQDSDHVRMCLQLVIMIGTFQFTIFELDQLMNHSKNLL